MPGNKLKSIDKAGFGKLLNFENSDKLVHGLMFFVLAFLYQFLKDYRLSKLILVPFLISFLIEILQGIMPFGRTFDWYDLLANTIGILMAVGLVQSIKKAKS
ncbi:VanZ family protein [Faecalibacter bovis]|uniref:VanZ family protein n=2 Tax=Faecalibacter bovis TaxID=2898187 RepID=A0ABX7XES1_9FLAO|nr:VanZ family protein [Faecalibacter bovis]